MANATATVSNFRFFSRLFSELDTALNTYVNDTATNVIAAITPVATTLITIYVMLWGWSMMRGVIQEPIMDGVGRIVRLSIITAVALQIGYYNGFLSDMLWNSPEALASYIVGGNGTPNAVYLDTLMSKIFNFAGAYHQKAKANSSYGIPDLGLLGIAVALWLSGGAAVGYGAFLLALAKMSLAVLLGVGPLFVLLAVFEPTKRFFDAWIGQALNFVFLAMLSAASIKLIMTVLEKYLMESGARALADPSIDRALPAIMFSVIGTLVLIQMPSISSALGGGVAISTLGAVRWGYEAAKRGLSLLKPSNIRRAYNAAKTVASAPMAIYRKITGGPRNRAARG